MFPPISEFPMEPIDFMLSFFFMNTYLNIIRQGLVPLYLLYARMNVN